LTQSGGGGGTDTLQIKKPQEHVDVVKSCCFLDCNIQIWLIYLINLLF
jgi:hypothetical protein